MRRADARALRVLLALGLVELVACGSVTMSPLVEADAGADANGAAGTTGAAGAAAAAGTSGAAGTSSPAADAGVEEPPAIPACGGTMALSGAMECINYRPGLKCMYGCRDETGAARPAAGGPPCTLSGQPRYNGTYVCASSCAACPAVAPF